MGYKVSGAGTTECNGTYSYYDEYDGHPRYKMTDSNGNSFYISWGNTLNPAGAMGWILSHPNGLPYCAPNSPTDSTPENAPWVVFMTSVRY
jgi:hypothetical protein